jgi:hypothetical protein
MTKNSTKVYSAEELNTLQEKYLSGDILSKEELIAIGVEKVQGATPDLMSQLEKIADIMLQKAKGGAALGGTPFVPASPEEVANRKKLTMEEKAKEYFDSVDLPNFPWPGIHVTDDLLIFIGHVQGENARDNHIRENNGMKFESFPKPQ